MRPDRHEVKGFASDLSKYRYDFCLVLPEKFEDDAQVSNGATMSSILTTALLLGMTTTGLVPSGDQAEKAESSALNGKWQAVEAELAGKKFPPQAAKSIQLAIDGEKYIVTTAEGEDRGTVRCLPDEKPSAMDIITGTNGPNKGKTFLAIYKIEGEQLVVCYDLAGKARPKEFKTEPKSSLFLVTYRKLNAGPKTTAPSTD